jgi:hypothetical protein
LTAAQDATNLVPIASRPSELRTTDRIAAIENSMSNEPSTAHIPADPDAHSPKRNALIIGLVFGAIALHFLVCKWSVHYPSLGNELIARVPNVVRYISGQGPRWVHLSTGDSVGRIVGATVGVGAPLVLTIVAMLLRFRGREFKQILGAGACILVGFGLVVFLTWAFSYW